MPVKNIIIRDFRVVPSNVTPSVIGVSMFPIVMIIPMRKFTSHKGIAFDALVCGSVAGNNLVSVFNDIGFRPNLELTVAVSTRFDIRVAAFGRYPVI